MIRNSISKDIDTIELWECATRTLIIPFHKNIVIEKTYMFHFQERD